MKKIWILLCVSCFFCSCKDDEQSVASNSDVNAWIYDVMDEVYLWTDFLPARTGSNDNPETYFNSLLFNGDRFSAIFADFDGLIALLNGVTEEAGYELQFLRTSPTDIGGIILYVKEGSPAADLGLIRGDLITSINGQSITEQNIMQLVGELSSDHEITYSRFMNGGYSDRGSLSLTTIQYSENPSFLHTIINSDDAKIGYFVYNFFSDGNEGDNYDAEVDAIFREFKEAQITDLVLDFRYNGGGAVSSATSLASLIAPNVSTSTVFFQNEYNDILTEQFENDPEFEPNGFFVEKTENIGDLIDRVYVLTGSRTASASELVINGLSPFIEIVLIGESTVGKNVGSIPINDINDPNNPYGLLPIVLRISNSEGNSDYASGFQPTGNNQINEFDFPLQPLGNTEEPLLARAIELINGSTLPTRIQRGELLSREVIFDPKTTSPRNNLIMR